MSKQPSKKLSSLQISQNEFSARMIRALWNDENVIVSPFSIFVALSMCLVGADGDTFTEIAKALCVECEKKDFKEWKNGALKSYLDELSDQILKNNSLLSVARTMLGSQSCHVKDAFKKDMVTLFDSEIKSDCDFAGNRDQVAKEINEWVSAATNNKIQDIMSPSLIDPLTVLILVNAIHFLGNWADQFNKNQTEEDHEFHTVDGEELTCNMMVKGAEQCKNKMYGSDGNYHYLQMPYTNEDYAMIFAAPDDDVTLDEDSEKQFSEWFCDRLQNVKKNFTFKKQNLSTIKIPRFEVNQGVELSKVLQTDFNMSTAFSETKANFSPMTDVLIKIDKIIHKAFIRVDEEGTEAAAATVVAMKKRKKVSGEKLPEFVLDRPFGYALIHLPTHSVLFCGRIVKP